MTSSKVASPSGVVPAIPGGIDPGGGSRPSLRKAMRVFTYRHYQYLWVSSTFSFVGMQMQQVARALLAWELSHSYSAVGVVSLAFGLPMVLFALVGGAIADRTDRRNLILMTQSVTSVLMFLTALLVATGVITIEQLVIIGLVQGTFFALGMPARTPLMADVVGPDNVMSAIAMSNASMNMTCLIGPALAGVLVGVWGMEFAYWAQSAMFAFSAVTLLFVPSGLSAALRVGRRAPEGVFTEIRRGLAYVSRDSTLRRLTVMMFIVSLFANPYVMLLAGYVQRDLGAGPGAYGMLQSVSGIGALAGSLAIATITDYDRKPAIQWVCGLLGGLGLVLLTLASRTFGLGGAAGAVVWLGLTFIAYQTLNNTMMMDAAKPEYYGRVMSINMITFSVMPLMAAPLGVLADRVGAGELFIILGAIVAGCMVLAGIFNPRYTFGRTREATWRTEARAAAQTTRDSVTADGSASAHLRAPVAPASAVPSSGGDGYGSPTPTGAAQVSPHGRA